MHRHFRTETQAPLERWREVCVDGVLHVAYAAALAAESAAHRCVESLDSSRPTSRKRGRLALGRGKRRARRPSNGRAHQRRRGG